MDTIGNPALGPSLQNLQSSTFFSGLLSGFVTLAFIIGAVMFVFMFIFGAIQWISSGGDKQALEQAQGRIRNALIGLVILFSLFAVINLIEYFFKIDLLNINLVDLKIGGLKTTPSTGIPAGPGGGGRFLYR